MIGVGEKGRKRKLCLPTHPWTYEEMHFLLGSFLVNQLEERKPRFQIIVLGPIVSLMTIGSLLHRFKIQCSLRVKSSLGKLFIGTKESIKPNIGEKIYHF